MSVCPAVVVDISIAKMEGAKTTNVDATNVHMNNLTKVPLVNLRKRVSEQLEDEFSLKQMAKIQNAIMRITAAPEVGNKSSLQLAGYQPYLLGGESLKKTTTYDIEDEYENLTFEEYLKQPTKNKKTVCYV